MFFLALITSVHLRAQDPVVMTINGRNVLRSEFEYSFNKNNSGDIRSWKAIQEYLPLFIDYKLKVVDAEMQRFDTLSSFRNEYRMYRDQQIKPLVSDPSAIEQKAREMYESIRREVEPDGMVKVAHILLRVGMNEQKANKNVIKNRADSIYQALLRGADFASLARRYSQDDGSATNGGELPWFSKRRTIKEFEDVAYAMTDGQISRPFTTPLGYHIVKKIGFKHLEPYEQVKDELVKTIVKNKLAVQSADSRIAQMIAKSGGTLTSEQAMEQLTAEQTAKDINLKYLIQEYRDGLLLFEAARREVWDKAANDEASLEHYYHLHESMYLWASPRYRGIIVYCTDKDVAKKVRQVLKKQPEDSWEYLIRTQVNTNSEKLCRFERGIFKQGDNASVDSLMFKVKGVDGKKYETYPVVIFEGKKLLQPESFRDVRKQLVPDYQKVLEQDWIAGLRKKYAVVVKEDALKTVNNH